VLNVDKNNERVRFIWSITDLLLGPYCPNQHKDIMLPMTALRRRNSVLELTKGRELERHKSLQDGTIKNTKMGYIFEVYVRELNPDAGLEVFAQDYNDQVYAICGPDMMIKGKILDNIRFGDSFTVGNFRDKSFDYMLTNLPFGVEWKPQQSFIQKEHAEHGVGGRFGVGLPRINDGSFLFLLHIISKMKDHKEGGTQLSSVFNGSPLFKAILMALSERDEAADICTDKKGNPEHDPELRDYEKVHLKDNITDYIAREVLPHVPDAWVDGSKTKIGYKINFKSYFYRYTPPRPLEEIEIDLKGIKKEIAEMLEVTV